MSTRISTQIPETASIEQSVFSSKAENSNESGKLSECDAVW